MLHNKINNFKLWDSSLVINEDKTTHLVTIIILKCNNSNLSVMQKMSFLQNSTVIIDILNNDYYTG